MVNDWSFKDVHGVPIIVEDDIDKYDLVLRGFVGTVTINHHKRKVK